MAGIMISIIFSQTLFQIPPEVQGLLHPELTDIGASVAQAAIKVAELRL